MNEGGSLEMEDNSQVFVIESCLYSSREVILDEGVEVSQEHI